MEELDEEVFSLLEDYGLDEEIDIIGLIDNLKSILQNYDNNTVTEWICN